VCKILDLNKGNVKRKQLLLNLMRTTQSIADKQHIIRTWKGALVATLSLQIDRWLKMILRVVVHFYNETACFLSHMKLKLMI